MLTLLLGLTLIATAAVSCRPAPTAEPTGGPADDLQHIRPNGQLVVFWYPYTQGHGETLLALVDEFNAANEWDITVIAEYAGPTDAIYDRVSARIGSQPLPEIVVAERHQAAHYAMHDGLVALDPYVGSEQWGYTQEELADFFPTALAADTLPQFNGRYIWLIGESAEVLYYNEDWLAKLGYTEPPRTWEAFQEMACAASDPEAGTYGYEFSAEASTFANMLLNQGGRMISEDGAAYAFGSSEGLEELTFLQTLLVEGCASRKTERFGDRADFGAGKVLFTVGSTANLPDYRGSVIEGAGFKWSIAPLPTSLDAPTVHVQESGLSLLRSTPEKQLAAWLFLKWLAEPEQQARWVRATHTLPVRISTTGLLQDHLQESPQYEKALSFLSCDAAFEPGLVGYGECRDAIVEMLMAVANLEHPQTWLTSTANACDASLPEATQP